MDKKHISKVDKGEIEPEKAPVIARKKVDWHLNVNQYAFQISKGVTRKCGKKQRCNLNHQWVYRLPNRLRGPFHFIRPAWFQQNMSTLISPFKHIYNW